MTKGCKHDSFYLQTLFTQNYGFNQDDPGVEYWILFIKRMEKIPPDYQMAILDEYEKAENTGHQMNVEKMWDLLLAGEEEVGLTARGVSRRN